MSREGYVYVLSTTSISAGRPVIKIGMTTRPPEKRVKELSRGGPTAMRLEGFVTTRDARALERWAHEEFASRNILGGGGREYFAVSVEEALSWLRTAVPRFEVASARQAAWAEFCDSKPYKDRARLGIFPIWVGGVAFWIGLLWHPNIWVTLFAGPASALLALCAIRLICTQFVARLDARCAELMTQLEEKYHLPPGGVRAPGP